VGKKAKPTFRRNEELKAHQFPGPVQPRAQSTKHLLAFNSLNSVVVGQRAETMATSTMSSMTTRSPASSMNPTSTEHDFRFPRRPVDPRSGPLKADRDGSSPSSNSKASAGDLRADLQELRLDLTVSHSGEQDGLQSAVFPPFQNGILDDDSHQTPEELQKQDPLAAQVWRFFSKTKQMLPNQERMENLTWRMMHMNLRKRREEEQRAR